MAGQCCFRNAGNCWAVIPSTPALPLLALTRFNACLQFSRSQTSSINCSVMAGLSVPRFPANDSVPSGRYFGASPPSSSRKANTSWFFCRLSPMSRAAYSPLPLPSLRRTVWAFVRCRTITPAADFCRPVRLDRSTLSPDSRTNGRSPEVSSTAFRTQPPEFTTSALDGYGLRCQLPARPALYASNPVLVHRLVRLLHASFRPRLATTPLRFAMTSPPSGCQGDFHPRAVEHARHTTKKPGVPRGARCEEYL
jgi:hypothetical protein